ncbi:hypothetical protein JTB14_001721 [Gonioctena quinquepunctata]|nr:hypothetical protein JTB14_001721 [Gonioctena quinquepunctata]
MPRYQAISQSHMTPRRRRRMKWAFLNTQQECRINKNTKNDPGSVFAQMPVKSILEVTEASDNTFAANIPILTPDNAEGIINTSNRFEDQVGNPFFDESIESSDINNTIDQFSRSVDLEEHKTTLISDLRQCFLEENIGHSAATRILKILKNIPHSWPRPTVSGSNNDYPHMTDQVSMEHNENIHHTWPQPSVPVPNNQNRPDQVPVPSVPIPINQHRPDQVSVPAVPVPNNQHRPDQVPVEYNGNLSTTLERKIDRLTDLVGRILVEIDSMKNQRGSNEPLHNEFRNRFSFQSIESMKEFDEQLHADDRKKNC